MFDDENRFRRENPDGKPETDAKWRCPLRLSPEANLQTVTCTTGHWEQLRDRLDYSTLARRQFGLHRGFGEK